MNLDVAQYFTVLSVALVKLLALTATTSLLSWGVLRLTEQQQDARIVSLLTLLVAYHIVLFYLLTPREVFVLGLLFVLFHLAFVFRFLSAVYFHRRPGPSPRLGFHVAMLVAGPRQHYGAGSWKELGGRHLDRGLFREWASHTGYHVGMLVLFLLITRSATVLQYPLWEVVRRAGFLLVGLELLAVVADLMTLAWAVPGHAQGFFSRYTWIRSRHLGEFWRNWNFPAIRAFRELSSLLGLQRRMGLNTLAVFFVSGVLHQVTILYSTRHPSYGTLLSFMIHGVLIVLIARARMLCPERLRPLAFNPATTAVTVALATQPFLLDLYGHFRISLP